MEYHQGMTKADLIRQALELPLDEQLDLAQTLWEHASPETDFTLTAELRDLLESRRLEARSDVDFEATEDASREGTIDEEPPAERASR